MYMMKENITKGSHGFIKLILIIIVIVLILSYFGINLRSVAESDAGKSNFSFIWDILLKIWGWITFAWANYLAEPAGWLWDNLIATYIWPAIQNTFSQMKGT